MERRCTMRNYVVIGSLNMALAVALGAFGAHILKESIAPGMLEIYQTGNHYHMIHGLGLMLVALFFERLAKSKLLIWSARLLFIGIIIFSGSLYLLAISGVKMLGAITPIGGFCFIVGWLLLGTAVLKKK